MHNKHCKYSTYPFTCNIINAGTNLSTKVTPSSTDATPLIFEVTATPKPYDVSFFINAKREISFRGCLDYEV